CRACVPPGCLTGGSGGCTPAGPALQSPVAFVYPPSAERGIQERTQLATMDGRRGAPAPPDLGEEHAETQRHWQREWGHSVYWLYGHGGDAAPAPTTATSTGPAGPPPPRRRRRL